MICTSRAADRPWCQLGRRMSAGRRNESGMTPEASLHGARAPDWAAVKSTQQG